jgi:hypothetical protein
MFMELKRAAALGAKYGLRAIPMYTDASVPTPEIDEKGMEGAVGIVEFSMSNKPVKSTIWYLDAELPSQQSSSLCTSPQLSLVA